MDLAFENLVANNYRHLLPHLHLEGLAITSAGPYLRRAAKVGTRIGSLLVMHAPRRSCSTAMRT